MYDKALSMTRTSTSTGVQDVLTETKHLKRGPTVFVVDSDPRTVQVVRTLVGTMDWGCESFPTGEAFLRAVDISRTGCVVLEALAEDVNGLQVQQILRSRNIALPIIFVAAHSSVSIAVRALRAGGLHFFQKPFGENELWDAIHEAIALDEEQRSANALHQDHNARLESLTVGETQVLDLLVAGAAKQRVASQLGICVRTVELRRKRILKKIGVDSTVDLVRIAMIAKGHAMPSEPHLGRLYGTDAGSHRRERGTDNGRAHPR